MGSRSEEYVRLLSLVGDPGTGKTTLIQTHALNKNPENIGRKVLDEKVKLSLSVGISIHNYEIYLNKDSRDELEEGETPNYRLNFTTYDYPGQKGFKELSKKHYKNSHGSIIVLNSDSGDRDRFPKRNCEWNIKEYGGSFLMEIEQEIKNKKIQELLKDPNAKINEKEILAEIRANYFVIFLFNKMDLPNSQRDKDKIITEMEEYKEYLISLGYKAENIHYNFISALENQQVEESFYWLVSRFIHNEINENFDYESSLIMQV